MDGLSKIDFELEKDKAKEQESPMVTTRSPMSRRKFDFKKLAKSRKGMTVLIFVFNFWYLSSGNKGI